MISASLRKLGLNLFRLFPSLGGQLLCDREILRLREHPGDILPGENNNPQTHHARRKPTS